MNNCSFDLRLRLWSRNMWWQLFSYRRGRRSIGLSLCNRNTGKKNSQYGTSLEALYRGPIELSVMTKCSILNTCMNQRSSTAFGMNSSSLPRRLGNGYSNKLILTASLLQPCSKGLTKHEESWLFFVEGIYYVLSGIGRDNVGRLSGIGGGYLDG